MAVFDDKVALVAINPVPDAVIDAIRRRSSIVSDDEEEEEEDEEVVSFDQYRKSVAFREGDEVFAGPLAADQDMEATDVSTGVSSTGEDTEADGGKKSVAFEQFRKTMTDYDSRLAQFAVKPIPDGFVEVVKSRASIGSMVSDGADEIDFDQYRKSVFVRQGEASLYDKAADRSLDSIESEQEAKVWKKKPQDYDEFRKSMSALNQFRTGVAINPVPDAVVERVRGRSSVTDDAEEEEELDEEEEVTAASFEKYRKSVVAREGNP